MEFNYKKPYRGSKSLSHALDIVTKPVFLKRGFAENRIITDWAKIVGDHISSCSLPRKLTFAKDKKSNGTLYVEVSNSGFSAQMVYIEPMILEKIACYFGYKAVSKIKIIQNPQNTAQVENPKLSAKKEISDKASIKLEKSLENIEDEELKESLRSLGRNILE